VNHVGSVSANLRHGYNTSMGALPTDADVERHYYDPWGRRQFMGGAVQAELATNPNTVSRGFGMHESLDGVGAIHMNGRAYDPILGRFISADPIVSSPGDLQAYNRYSYVGNRPIMVTDPTGYSWLDSVFSQPLHATVTNLDRGALGNRSLIYHLNVALARLAMNHPRAYDNLSAFTSGACGYYAALCQAGAAEFRAGVHSTSTSYGAQVGFETLAKASMTSMLFYGAGQAVGNPNGTAIDTTDNMGQEYKTGNYTNGQIATKVALHVAAGCVSAAVNEGSCGRGAASAGTSALFTGMTTGHIASPWVQGALTVTIGGGASVIGGGKFRDGATVALAGYLWNEMVSKKSGEKFKTSGKAYSGAQGLSEDLSKSLNRMDYPEMDLERAASLSTIAAGPATGIPRTVLLGVGMLKDSLEVFGGKYDGAIIGNITDKFYETVLGSSRWLGRAWGLVSEMVKPQIEKGWNALNSPGTGGPSGLGRCHQCLPTAAE
jgi:RHS repeat-associated protein